MISRENQTGGEPANAPVQPRKQPKRILVVDDDADVRQFTVDILTESGYEVQCAKDGAAGWDTLQGGGYDLVITDNQMPRMTGMEMIEKLRAARTAPPIILATRHVPRYELNLRPWLEPDALLERPFSDADLLGVVKKILGPGDGGEEVWAPLLPKYV